MLAIIFFNFFNYIVFTLNIFCNCLICRIPKTNFLWGRNNFVFLIILMVYVLSENQNIVKNMDRLYVMNVVVV